VILLWRIFAILRKIFLKKKSYKKILVFKSFFAPKKKIKTFNKNDWSN